MVKGKFWLWSLEDFLYLSLYWVLPVKLHFCWLEVKGGLSWFWEVSESGGMDLSGLPIQVVRNFLDENSFFIVAVFLMSPIIRDIGSW